MRLKIVIGLMAKGAEYREFTRVVDLPVMPERIDVGPFTLSAKDADEHLTYCVTMEMYRVYWEVDITETEKGGFATAADRALACGAWLLDEGFVTDPDDETEGVEGET